MNYSSDAKMIPKSAIKRSGSNEPSRAVKNKLAKTAKKVFLILCIQASLNIFKFVSF